jgi:SNF2 family DNA or RNA helicase
MLAAKINQFRKWLTGAGLSEKEHQISGMKFCLERETTAGEDSCRGGIIADEMGLGKTILMLGCIVSNFNGKGGLHNTLVILPPSLLTQWHDIIVQFMGHSPLIFHGHKSKTITQDQLESSPIVLTTYGMISETTISGPRLLCSVKWNRFIADEAHHIRNKGRAYYGMKKIDADIKWLVTGTPIQNNTKDFFALCSILGLEREFRKSHLTIKDVISKHVLRRTKNGVGIVLPALHIKTIDVPWASPEEKNIAEQIHSMIHFSEVTPANGVDALITALTGGGNTLPAMIRARQCCVYPQLLKKPISKLQQRGQIPSDLNIDNIKTNSKMDFIVNHIEQRETNGRRKILFCHYRSEIDYLSETLTNIGITNICVDGRTSKSERKYALDPTKPFTEPVFRAVCKKWSEEGTWMFENIEQYISPHQVLIVQIQTACEGLNLQHFQEIYFTSPHFNPAVETQAIARSHRIGQTEEVEVFRFVMENFNDYEWTLDKYCMYVQEEKLKLNRLLDNE